MPKVSIIMPVYNGEKYICESIESIIKQTFTDWELIIINEFGSNIKTTNILNKYEKRDSRIKVIQNAKRVRIAESLNIGIRFSGGEYIARMDSDDLSGEQRIEQQVKFLDMHQNVGVVGIHPTVFGDAVWDWNTEYDSKNIYSDTLFFLPFLHPTVMIRREVLIKNQIEYNPDYFYTEDYDFFERLLQVTKAANINDKSLFRYRIHGAAATFAGKETGKKIYKEVMTRALQRMGLSFSEEELSLLYIHEGVKGYVGSQILIKIDELDLLLKQIFIQNLKKLIFDKDALFTTLHKRWQHLWDSDIAPAYNHKVPKIMKEQFERSIFFQEEYWESFSYNTESLPDITVLLPIYNGQNYIFEAIKSIQNQTYKKWELLIVDDASSDDSVLIIKEYQKKDSRIRLICNEKNMRIARTLNKGIKEARGVYVARMDDDDISLPERLEKEKRILDESDTIAVVGSWQKHFGTTNWVHKPPELLEEMKAALLFECCVCHSTVMFKKNVFIENDFYYDPDFLSEDYELWTRVSRKYGFYTIPEVLGEYRLNGDNITAGKIEKFDIEARNISADQLLRNLGLKIKEEDKVLLAKWSNPFINTPNEKKRKELLKREQNLLGQIKNANLKKGYYDQSALERILDERWKWANGEELVADNLSEGLHVRKVSSLKQNIRRILRPLYRPFRNRYENRILEIQNTVWDLDGHLRDYAQVIMDKNFNLQNQISKIEMQYFDLMNKMSEAEQYTDRRMNAYVQEAMENAVRRLDAQILSTQKNMIETLEAYFSDIISDANKSMLQMADTRIWKAEKNILKSQEVLAELIHKLQNNKKKIVMINTPDHDNLGDHAIAYAEQCWIKDHTDYQYVDITGNMYRQYSVVIRRFISEEDIIALSGGGYIGSVWDYEEKLVEKIVLDYPNNRILIFPQSVFFENNEMGIKKMEKAKYIFQNHSNLCLMVREERSLDFVRKKLSGVYSDLYPDMTFYLYEKFSELAQKKASTKHAALCLKTDIESVVNENDREEFQKILEKNFSFVSLISTLSEEIFEKEDRFYYIRKKVYEFSKYDLIVTDRLHGMLFSVLARTDCILLPSKTYKNEGVYAMIKDYRGVYMADKLNVEKAVIGRKDWGRMQKDNEGYVNMLKRFDKLSRVISGQ